MSWVSLKYTLNTNCAQSDRLSAETAVTEVKTRLWAIIGVGCLGSEFVCHFSLKHTKMYSRRPNLCQHVRWAENNWMFQQMTIDSSLSLLQCHCRCLRKRKYWWPGALDSLAWGFGKSLKMKKKDLMRSGSLFHRKIATWGLKKRGWIGNLDWACSGHQTPAEFHVLCTFFVHKLFGNHSPLP